MATSPHSFGARSARRLRIEDRHARIFFQERHAIFAILYNLATDLQREAAESFVKDWNEMLASIASKSAAFKAAG